MQLALNGSYVVVGIPNVGTSEKSSIDELESLGTLAMSVDWETESGGNDLIEAVRDKFGRLDLLVNCLKSDNDTAKNTDGTIEHYLNSVCQLTEKAVQLMSERPKPRIVNVVSACDTEIGSDPVFAATQAGIIGLTKALAIELPKHFRINALSISEKMAAANGFDPELVRPQPMVSPDDAARTILFLLPGESARIHGQVLSLG